MIIHNPIGVARADFKTNLFNQTLGPDALPTDIQFMPPGVHTICPTVDGAPFPMTIKVDQELADKLNSQLQFMREKSSQGHGDVPFIDFNHEDAASSGEVLELFWGGPEMGNGGIRMKINWTAAGVAALRGKMYRRFSPAWLLDVDTKEPVGVGSNLGGLVNRAAFQNIQPIVAKSVSERLEMLVARAMNAALGPMIKGLQLSCQMLTPAVARHSDPVAVNANSTDSQPNEFLALVTARQADKKISFERALTEIQCENPGATAAYAKAMRNPAPALSVENHPFLVEAKVIAAAKGISETDAQVHLARANFPLYQQYCASLHQSGQKGITVKAADSGQQDFLCEVRAKQSGGMSFDEAVNAVALSRPDLSEGYRRSFRVKSK